MSKYKDIYTDEGYMTKQNALRYYLTLARKAQTRNDYIEMYRIYNMAENEPSLNVDPCVYCELDTFGRCAFDRMVVEDKFVKCCFDALIFCMKNQLRWEMNDL